MSEIQADKSSISQPLLPHNSAADTRSQNSKLLQVETESLQMCGWILRYRNVNNSVRLSLAVYNSYQNAIIPQRLRPVSLSTERLQVSSFDDSMKSLLGGFCSFEQRSVMFVFPQITGRNGAPHILHVALALLPVCPVWVFHVSHVLYVDVCLLSCHLASGL